MKEKGSLRRLLTLALLIMTLAGTAGAADWYIRTDGNDSNTGTADTAGAAWLTIGKVRFATINPGDVVHVGSGTYDENGAYGLFAGGYTIRGATPNRPVLRRITLDVQDTADGMRLENLDLNDAETHITIITVRSGVQGFALVGCDVRNPLSQNDPGDANRNHGCVLVEQANNVLVEDCRLISTPGIPTVGRMYCLSTQDQFPASNNWTIRHTTMNMQPGIPSAAGGNFVVWTEISNVLIEDCVFTWSPRENIIVASNSVAFNLTNWTVRRCRFLGTTNVTNLGVGTAHNLINWRIENNYFTQSADSAIRVYSGAATSADSIDGLVVTGNTFEDIAKGTVVNTDGIIVLDNVKLVPTAGRQTLISNNTFSDTRGGAHGGWGIYVRGNGPGPQITDNSFNNTRQACILVGGSPYAVAGDFATGQVDPVVVGNTVNGNVYGGVVVRYESSAEGVGVVRNAVVDNNTIQSANQYGISVETSNALNTNIRLNDILQCGAGIHIAGQATVRGNEVVNSLNAARGGIWLTPFAVNSDVSNSVVAFNLTAQCAGYGVRVEPTLGNRGQNLRVYNNTVAGNQPSGILIGVDSMACYNNIIALHTGPGLVFSATTVGLIGFNLHFNALTGGTSFSGFPGPTTFPGDIVEQDPLFVDFSTLNFHLQPNSPAILAAALEVAGSLIAGGGDMGAYPTGVVSAEVKPGAWELYR